MNELINEYTLFLLQVSVLLLLLVVLSGAALGFWVVRKFVISEDGTVDVGIAQFVKWSMRVIAATAIFQVCYFFDVVCDAEIFLFVLYLTVMYSVTIGLSLSPLDVQFLYFAILYLLTHLMELIDGCATISALT